MKYDSLAKDLESLVRYITPGFTLLAIALLADYPIGDYLETSQGLLVLPFLGIAWYACHRTVLNIIDYGIYAWYGHDISVTYRQNMAENAKTNRGYVYSRLANLHLALIVGEQAICLSFFAVKHSHALFDFGVAFIIISFVSYSLTLNEFCKYDKAVLECEALSSDGDSQQNISGGN